MKRRLWQFLIAYDQFVHAMFGLVIGGAWADETFSSRCWRERNTNWLWATARRVIDGLALLFGDRNHCELSYTSERLRLQSPPEERLP